MNGVRLAPITMCVVTLVAACGGETHAPEVAHPQAPSMASVASPPPAVVAEPAPPSSEAPKLTTEVAKHAPSQLVEMSSKHDAKALAALYAEDASVVQAGAEPLHGRAAIADDAQKIFDAIASAKWAASRAWAALSESTLAYEWAMTGTHSGELKGVKPTEKPVGFVGLSILVLTPDGLVKEEHRYADMATLLAQIGASRSKARPVPQLATTTEWHVSTGDTPRPGTAAMGSSPGEDANAQLPKRLWAAVDAKNGADFLALHAADVVYDDATSPTPVRGKDELGKWFKAFTTAFPDARGTITRAFGVDDYVVFESTWTGTQKSAYGGISASNVPVTLHAADVARMSDGKISHDWAYGNAQELTAQVVKAPPPKSAAPRKPAQAPKK